MIRFYLLIIIITVYVYFSSITFLATINVNIVNAHVGEKEHGEGKSEMHAVVLSKHKDGNIELTADPMDKQWRELSSQIDIDSLYGHKISVNSLNNLTHVFFLLSWNDSTKGYHIGALREINNHTIYNTNTDGAKIVFEPHQEEAQTTSIATKDDVQNRSNNIALSDKKNNSGSVWYWDSLSPTSLSVDKEGVITKAQWKNNQWHVIIGKRILDGVHNTQSNNTTTYSLFKPGILQKGLLKFVVWDSAEGESLNKTININDNKDDKLLQAADFILLPTLNIYPKDVYLWSGILIIGVIFFVLLEIKLHNGLVLSKQERKEEDLK